MVKHRKQVTSDAVADKVWDELQTEHVTPATMGAQVDSIKTETDKIPSVKTETDKIQSIRTETDKIQSIKDETDLIKHLTRPQKGTQSTTAALDVVGSAIEHATIPFIVEGWLSLHNMQAGDTFLVVEEIRDQDDATYREYGRNSYSDVQTSPMVHFSPKRCQGWRIRIQRTAGGDRDVTYQFFLDQEGV